MGFVFSMTSFVHNSRQLICAWNFDEIGFEMAPFVKRRMLTPDEKKVIIKLHEDSIKQTEIARLFSVNRSTVCGIIRRTRYER